ncbi:hypothetical protein ACNKHX_07585 [Shigella flexneri]
MVAPNGSIGLPLARRANGILSSATAKLENKPSQRSLLGSQDEIAEGVSRISAATAPNTSTKWNWKRAAAQTAGETPALADGQHRP